MDTKNNKEIKAAISLLRKRYNKLTNLRKRYNKLTNLRKRYNKLTNPKGIVVKRNFPIEINFFWDNGIMGNADLNWDERELWQKLQKHIDKVENSFNKEVKKLCDDSDKYAIKFGIPKDSFWNYVMGAKYNG